MVPRPILLASRSPQRAALLRAAGIPFVVVATDGDEETVRGLPAEQLCLARARVKALGAHLPAQDHDRIHLVLGADTVVACEGVIYGSPADAAEATAILQALQGTTHAVMTGHWCIALKPGLREPLNANGAVAQATVTMRPMSSAEIADYVATGESIGRAGAYAIQERGDRLVTARSGDFDTIVGLNVATVRRLLEGIWPLRAES
jgi:septum formation protein